MAERTPHISSIFTCDDAGLAMESREEVNAIAGVGLAGDRYAEGKGAFSKKKGPISKEKADKIRHISLISSEAISETDFLPEETRRNLVTTGVDLNALVGEEFQVGSVRMRGTELCHPCTRPTILYKKAGFKDQLDNKGGLRAEILSSGTIKKGDPIHVFGK